jgi:hypothetical protein
MGTPLRPADNPDREPDEVDVDLDLISESLRREAARDTTTVRIDGQIIHIVHAGDWTTSAMRSASIGDWDTWAREVIEDDEEFRTWQGANLRNYQVEAVFNECGRQARMTLGKSRRPSGSRKGSRRK